MLRNMEQRSDGIIPRNGVFDFSIPGNNFLTSLEADRFAATRAKIESEEMARFDVQRQKEERFKDRKEDISGFLESDREFY